MGEPRSESAWLAAVRRVVGAVRATDVEELEISQGDFSVRVRRNVTAAVTAGPAAVGGPSAADAGHSSVVAPLTGIFYRSPSPNAPSYVNVGDVVEADTVVGLIETMKIFNEVTADQAGRVVAFLAESNDLVHAGDGLLSIEPGVKAPSGGEVQV